MGGDVVIQLQPLNLHGGSCGDRECSGGFFSSSRAVYSCLPLFLSKWSENLSLQAGQRILIMRRSDISLLCLISSEPFINIKQGNEVAELPNKNWNDWMVSNRFGLCGFLLTSAIANGFTTPKHSFAWCRGLRSSFSFCWHCCHLIGTSHHLFTLLIEPN